MQLRLIAGAVLMLAAASACNSTSSNANLPPASPISVTPATMTFPNPTASSQPFVVTDKGFTGTFTQSSTCSGVATIAPVTNPAVGPTATWTVTPKSGGSCVATISDGTGATSVAIAVNGALTANPTALSFPSSSSVAQTFAISEYGYTGTFTETDTCGGVASVSPTGTVIAVNYGATYTVVPVRVGSCAVTITDGLKVSVSVPVTIL